MNKTEQEFVNSLFSRFYKDFSTAEKFGKNEIYGLYKNRLTTLTGNYRAIVELLNVLRAKIRYFTKTEHEFKDIYVEL
jgi:hypothetical protein